MLLPSFKLRAPPGVGASDKEESDEMPNPRIRLGCDDRHHRTRCVTMETAHRFYLIENLTDFWGIRGLPLYNLLYSRIEHSECQYLRCPIAPMLQTTNSRFLQ
jgi:hypothetical protein